MVDKYSSFSKIGQCLKPLTMSAVGNDDRMLRSKFLLLFANARGTGTPLTAKCPAPVTHRASNTRGDARGWI